MKEIKRKTPLTRTLGGAELVEVVTREMRLCPEQDPCMAIQILVGSAGKLLRVIPRDNGIPSLYVRKLDRNMKYSCISRSFLCITAAVVTGICEVTTVELL